VLDEDFDINAKYHVDNHVIKIPLEACQCLCNALVLNGLQSPYKLAQPNNPICKWVRSSIDNYIWACYYGLSLTNEYSYRYGKIHKCEYILKYCLDRTPKLPKIGRTSFYLAMPENYRSSNPIESYRKYYRGDKQHLAKWKKREIPTWFNYENHK
jgi:hypothetical protein